MKKLLLILPLILILSSCGSTSNPMPTIHVAQGYFTSVYNGGIKIPMYSDFDGDKKPDYAIYRPSDSVWYIINSSGIPDTIQQFGPPYSIPIAADYDGDGKTDIAVFNGVNIIYILKSSDQSVLTINFPVGGSWISGA